MPPDRQPCTIPPALAERMASQARAVDAAIKLRDHAHRSGRIADRNAKLIEGNRRIAADLDRYAPMLPPGARAAAPAQARALVPLSPEALRAAAATHRNLMRLAPRFGRPSGISLDGGRTFLPITYGAPATIAAASLASSGAQP